MSDEKDGTKPTVDVGRELDSFEQRLQAMMESSDLPVALPRDLVGTTIAATYTLVGKLGAGGMGEVYLAEHARTEGRVALKLIKSSRLADADGLKRFELEAKNTAGLEHPNIVRVFDYGHEDDLVYIAMEYIGGKSLRDMIEETGTLTVEEAVEVADAVLLALEAAHEASIVHRDIKAGNILIAGSETDRFVKVLDFGIARALEGEAVQTQGIIGTPTSMAPEQFEGGEMTPATDLYAVGCLMHVMLTGRGPFTGKNWQLATLHCVEPPPRLEGVPEALADWTLRLLEKEPDDRPPSARQAVEALRAITLDAEPTLPPQLADTPPQPTTRNVAAGSRIGGAVLVIVAAAAVAAVVWGAQEDDGPSPLTSTKTNSMTTGAPSPPTGPIDDHAPLELPTFDVFDFFLQLSPDGEKLVRSQGESLEVQDLRGGGTIALPSTRSRVYDVRWFEDSRRLLLSVENEDETHCLVQQTLDGTHEPLICRDGWLRGAVSPDGERLAYRTSDEVVIAKLDGSDARVVDGAKSPHRLYWLSDGSGVVFISHEDGANTYELRFAAPGKSALLAGNLKQNHLGAQDVPLAVLRDRRLIVGGRDGSDRALWVAQVDDDLKLTDVERLTEDQPFWFTRVSASRSGKVTYCRSSSQSDVEVAEFDGVSVANRRFVAATSSKEFAADWGEELLIKSDRTGKAELYAVDPAAGRVRPLTTSRDGWEAATSEFVGGDGDVIFFETSDAHAAPRLLSGSGVVTPLDVGREAPLSNDLKASPPWRMDIRCDQTEAPRCVLYEVSDLEGTFRELRPSNGPGDVIAKVPIKSPRPEARLWDFAGSEIVMAHGQASEGLTIVDTATGDITKVELNGEDAGAVFFITAVAWDRPAPKRVLMTSVGSLGYRLSAVSRDGLVTSIHASDGNSLVRPVPSPDGTQIAWTQNRYQCVPWSFQVADR